MLDLGGSHTLLVIVLANRLIKSTLPMSHKTSENASKTWTPISCRLRSLFSSGCGLSERGVDRSESIVLEIWSFESRSVGRFDRIGRYENALLS